MNFVPVNSLADPRVADYANIRDAELAQRADPLDSSAHRGLFIAEGELVVRRLISSTFPTRSVLTTPTRLNTIRDALDPPALPPQTPVYLVEQPVMDSIVGFNMHRGVLALGVRRPDPPLVQLLARPGPFLILEDTTNHDNLGGIFRNAAALGGPGCEVFLSPRCADPLYRKALRVSIGGVLSIPFARLDWPSDLAAFKAAGVRVLAMTPRKDSIDIADVAAQVSRDRTRVAIMLGAEGPGLTDQALAHADAAVRIPMNTASADFDSLNVAVAAGIALHRLAPAASARNI